jgi:hypothetical protein
MKLLRTILNDLRHGENIDLYLTIVAALGISLLSLINFAYADWIPSLTLAVLALLAVTNLVNRHKLDAALLSQHSVDKFMEEYPAGVKNDIKTSKELWLAGYVLGRTLIDNLGVIKEKLLRNESVKVLLFNPDSDAMSHFCASLSISLNQDELQSRINSSLETLRSLSRFEKKHPGKLEVRIFDHPLYFGAYAMDIRSPNGVMYIELYKYKGNMDEEPKVVLHKKDGHWFELYKDQLMSMWQDAKPYSLQ